MITLHESDFILPFYLCPYLNSRCGKMSKKLSDKCVCLIRNAYELVCASLLLVATVEDVKYSLNCHLDVRL